MDEKSAREAFRVLQYGTPQASRTAQTPTGSAVSVPMDTARVICHVSFSTSTFKARLAGCSLVLLF